MTHPQPKDLRSYPCATDVWVTRDSTVIKPHLVNSPPLPCQTLEVPLCPDFELACPPLASKKAKRWCVCSCVKRTEFSSPGHVCGACWEALGLMGRNNTSSCYRLKDLHWTVQLPATFKEPEWTLGVINVMPVMTTHMLRSQSLLCWCDHHEKHEENLL